MKYEFHFLFSLVAVGLLVRKLSWKGWFALALYVCAWIALCKMRG